MYPNERISGRKKTNKNYREARYTEDSERKQKKL